MKHPFLEIPRSRRLNLFVLFLALTLLAMMALNISGRALATDAAPSGIVSYEFSGDVASAEEIISSWDETARISAGFNLGLDYLYLLLYASTIAMALLWLTEGIRISWLTALAVMLAWAMGLAALLDASENYALFTMLVNGPAKPWPQVAWWCAAVKFGLVIAGLLLVLIGIIVRVLRRWRQ
ncbi:MAG: hypothetical protein PVJ75_05885 [Chloroflexota bacterium]|jgi:hypothetical protein